MIGYTFNVNRNRCYDIMSQKTKQDKVRLFGPMIRMQLLICIFRSCTVENQVQHPVACTGYEKGLISQYLLQLLGWNFCHCICITRTICKKAMLTSSVWIDFRFFLYIDYEKTFSCTFFVWTLIIDFAHMW